MLSARSGHRERRVGQEMFSCSGVLYGPRTQHFYSVSKELTFSQSGSRGLWKHSDKNQYLTADDLSRISGCTRHRVVL